MAIGAFRGENMRAAVLPALVGCVSLLAAACASAPPRPDALVAAVFPPWWTAQRSFAAASAGGLAVRFGRLPFVVLVAASGAGARARLRDAGVWLLLDLAALGGCLRPSRAALG